MITYVLADTLWIITSSTTITSTGSMGMGTTGTGDNQVNYTFFDLSFGDNSLNMDKLLGTGILLEFGSDGVKRTLK